MVDAHDSGSCLSNEVEVQVLSPAHMKLIVGLGNPGKEYDRTRHNVGFMFLDYLVAQTDSQPFHVMKKCESESTEVGIAGGRFLLVKPQTFMNESGRALRKCMDFYKVSQADVFVAHDDLDIQLGSYKIQLGKGPKVHNGVNSVELAVQSPEFMRIRIGIESRNAEQKMTGGEFVLSNFSDQDEKILDNVFKDIKLAISSLV